MKALLLVFLCICCCLPAYGATQCKNQILCIDTGDWRIAGAIGVGTRTNPIRDGDNQSLNFIGDVAWYSETFYLDNLEVGYQWQPDVPAFSVDSYLALDREGRPFSFFNGFDVAPLDLLSAEQLAIMDPNNTTRFISLDDVASRRNGVHAGVRFHFRQQEAEWQLAFEHDIWNVHQGSKIRLAYRYGKQIGDWLINFTPQLVWNDASFNDYYYGIDLRDTTDVRLWYHAGSGFRPGLNVSLSKDISEHWGILLFSRYQHLPSAISHSPLVNRHDITTYFVGITYRL